MTAIAGLPSLAVMPVGNVVAEGGDKGGSNADFAALLSARLGPLPGAGNAIAAPRNASVSGATRFVDGSLFGHWISAARGGALLNAEGSRVSVLPTEPESVEATGLLAQRPEQSRIVSAAAANAVRVAANEEAPVVSSVLPISYSALTESAQVLGIGGDDGAQVSAPKAQSTTATLALRAARVASFAPLHVAILAEASGHRLVLRAAGMPDDETHETVARLVEEAESTGISISAVTVNGKPFSLYGNS